MVSRKYYRYGIAAEKKVLEQCKDSYHGLVLPGHLVSDQTDTLKTFVKTLSKPYIIDPMTHVFSQWGSEFMSPKTGEPRRSYRKLSENLGSLFHIDLRNRRLKANDFLNENGWDQSKVSECVSRVLQFQRNMISEIDEEAVKYYEMASELGVSLPEGPIMQYQPEYLISPYFFFNGMEDPFYELTSILARKSVEEANSDESILAVLGTSPGYFSSLADRIDSLCEDFGGCHGIVLWGDNLREASAGKGPLKSFRSLVEGLHDAGFFVMNMFGSIFSGMLNKFGLDAYSSGLGYGESRPKEALIGGPLPPRMFIRRIYNALIEAEADKFYKMMAGILCVCETCMDIRKSIGVDESKPVSPESIPRFVDEMFAGGMAPRTKKHFIHGTSQELRDLNEMSVSEIVAMLDEKSKSVESKAYQYYYNFGRHLDTWKEVIGE